VWVLLLLPLLGCLESPAGLCVVAIAAVAAARLKTGRLAIVDAARGHASFLLACPAAAAVKVLLSP
jgi:hypothetical protein